MDCHVLSCVTLTSASSALMSSLGGFPSFASMYRAVATVEEILVSFCKRQINLNNKQVNSSTNLWIEQAQIYRWRLLLGVEDTVDVKQ